MPIHGIPTREERNELSSKLALLYLEKADTSTLTPSEFAKVYFRVKGEIFKTVEPYTHL